MVEGLQVARLDGGQRWTPWGVIGAETLAYGKLLLRLAG